MQATKDCVSLTDILTERKGATKESEMLQRSRTWTVDSAGRGNTEREEKKKGDKWQPEAVVGGHGRCRDLGGPSFPAGAVRPRPAGPPWGADYSGGTLINNFGVFPTEYSYIWATKITER